MEEKFNEAKNYFENGQYKEAISILTPLAENGHINACVKLGLIYLQGFGVRKNYKKAFNYLKVDADKNDSWAQYYLGYFYGDGLYVKKDVNKAIEYLEKSAKQGIVGSYHKLGYIYRDDLKDIQSAIKYFEKGALLGDIRCQIKLGDMYSYMEYQNIDLEKADYWYKKVYENKNLDDNRKEYLDFKYSLFLATYYDKCEDLLMKSIYLLNTLAKNKDCICQELAQKALSFIYRKDKSNEPNKAFYWQNKVDKGKGLNLARDYLEGFGTEANSKKALDLALEVAKDEKHKDCLNARMLVASWVENDRYGVEDKNLAFEMYEDLIKNHEKYIIKNKYGDVYAGYANLWLSGHCAFKKPNKYKAKEYYEKAYKLGFTECKSALDSVNLELGINDGENELEEYAKNLLKEKPSNLQIYQSVTNLVSDRFGKYYSRLSKEIKTYFIDALTGFVSKFSCGKAIYKELDFSNVILSLSKGLETILTKVFAEPYIEYLKKKNVPAKDFLNAQSRFIKAIKDKDDNIVDYEYINFIEDTGSFTLGSLYYWLEKREIEINKKIPKRVFKPKDRFGEDFEDFDIEMPEDSITEKRVEINPYMMGYLKTIWECNEETEILNEEKIIKEILSITKTLSYIAPQVRNPSAHRDIAPYWKAESLANYLLLSEDNFVCKILDKLKPNAYYLLK